MANDAGMTAPTVITNFRPMPIFALVGGPGMLVGLVLMVLASAGIYDALVLSNVPAGAYLEGLVLILAGIGALAAVMLFVKTPMELIIEAHGIVVRRPSALLFSEAPHIQYINRERIARMKANKVVTDSASEGSSQSMSYTVVFANKDGERVGTIEYLTSTDVVKQLADALNLAFEILD
jgi:hypothetical protein